MRCVLAREQGEGQDGQKTFICHWPQVAHIKFQIQIGRTISSYQILSVRTMVAIFNDDEVVSLVTTVLQLLLTGDRRKLAQKSSSPTRKFKTQKSRK